MIKNGAEFLIGPTSVDSSVRLWSVAGNQGDNTHIVLGTTSSQPPKLFYRVAFSPDGKLLAASNQDGRTFLWDASLTPPKLLRTLSKNDGPILAIAFSPDGKYLATGGLTTGLVCIWELTDPSVRLATSISPEKNLIHSLAYSPDGKSLVEGVDFRKSATPGEIWVWDVSQRPYVKKSIIRIRGKATGSIVGSCRVSGGSAA